MIAEKIDYCHYTVKTTAKKASLHVHAVRLMYDFQSIRSAFLGAPFPGARTYFTGARKERAPFSGEGLQAGARS